MMAFAVVTENDESQWADETGNLYHFPKRYRDLLKPGTQVLYYKGRLRNEGFRAARISPEPHYFAAATIGRVYSDKASDKGDLFATIENFQAFSTPVSIRNAIGAYFEEIPENRASNFWRDGVRSTSPSIFSTIAKLGGPIPVQESVGHDEADDEPLDSGLEGSKTQRFTTTYERKRKLRAQAIAIHGTTCFGCGFNFQASYGEYGKDLIHVHHIKPISKTGGPVTVFPETDLIPLCPNCHYMVHRKRESTLSLTELKKMIGKARKATA